MKFMKKLLLLPIGIIFLGGCVSNSAVRAVQPSDYNLSCDSLKYELADLGAKFEEAKDDSGFTGIKLETKIDFNKLYNERSN